MLNGTTPPDWLAPVQAALVESLFRLYGARDADGEGLASVITALLEAASQGELSIPTPGGALGQTLAASPLCREPDGPLVISGERLEIGRAHV